MQAADRCIVKYNQWLRDLPAGPVIMQDLRSDVGCYPCDMLPNLQDGCELSTWEGARNLKVHIMRCCEKERFIMNVEKKRWIRKKERTTRLQTVKEDQIGLDLRVPRRWTIFVDHERQIDMLVCVVSDSVIGPEKLDRASSIMHYLIAYPHVTIV